MLVTADEALLDEVLRLAAIAGTELDVVPDAVGGRPHWAKAPFVVVGADAAAGCATARLPRRRDVVLVIGHGAETAWSTDGRPSEMAWQLAADLGADQVAELPYAESWLVRRLTESHRIPSSAKVVATVPGSGGAGASVLAAGLATTAVRQSVRPLLVDADPLGGGLDVLLGWEERAGLRWPDLTEASGAMSVDGLYAALPRSGELVVLSWDRSDFLDVPLSAVDAVIDAGRRGSDLVIVDLPRRLDEAAVRVLQAADLVLLVARPDVRSCAAAARTSARVKLHSSAVEVVVRGPAPGNLRADDVCGALGVPLAGSLRPESGLPAALDRGDAPAATGRGPLAGLCRRLLGRLDVVTSDAA
ncbi:MAG: septum site-determining protein Ssd [Micromonosporaceae bacterium]